MGRQLPGGTEYRQTGEAMVRQGKGMPTEEIIWHRKVGKEMLT